MEISYTKAQPKAFFREVHITTVPITFIIWGLFMVVFRDWHMNGSPPLYNPSPIVAVVLAWIVALALSVQTTLFRHNRKRLRAVLKPTLGRVLTAALMAGLTPFVIFNWMPWVAGGLAFFGLLGTLNAFLWINVSSLVLTAIWYLPASLIISGVAAKKWRFALFCLTWWACYAGLILTMGVLNFSL